MSRTQGALHEAGGIRFHTGVETLVRGGWGWTLGTDAVWTRPQGALDSGLYRGGQGTAHLWQQADIRAGISAAVV